MNPGTRHIMDTVRIVESREVGHEQYEVCATAEAIYDEAAGQMRVRLHSFVRHFQMRGRDEIFRPPWLPREDSVEMHVALDEALDAAKEVFGVWTQKVRKAIPGSDQWQMDAPWLKAVAA